MGLLKVHVVQEVREILQFEGAYRFLSNFYPSTVMLNGVEYPTVEHAFQAAKSDDPVVRERFVAAATPADAKRMGRRVKLRPDWEVVKEAVMAALLRQKFGPNTHLMNQLLATWPLHLVEGNRWGDKYWGVDLDSGQGENKLGKLLMQLRWEIKLREELLP